MIKDGKYKLEVSADDYGRATKNEYEISSTSKNKILGLLHTGAQKTQLVKSGNTKYNWNHTFTKSVPHTYTFDSTPLVESTITYQWNKSDYRTETFNYSAKFGESKEESSSYLAQVYLDGLDGFLNTRTGEIPYEWQYYKVGERYKILGVNWMRRGTNKYGPYTDSDSTELDSKCIISIPMQSLINATDGFDLQYNPDTCKVEEANLTIKFKYWINDNLISKLDFTGTAAEFTEKYGISQVTDNLRYQASFGNVSSAEYQQELKYSLYTTDEFIKNEDIELKMNVVNSNALDSNKNEDVNITFSWDAEYLGMHIAITDIDLEIEYSINNDEEGIFKFYDL